MTGRIHFIPVLVPQISAVIVTSALVSRWGVLRMTHCVEIKHGLLCTNGYVQMPYILIGKFICICGVALLTRLVPMSSTPHWAASSVVTGLGLGMVMQLPYTAVQIVLK